MQGRCNANGTCQRAFKCAQGEVCVAPDNHCEPVANSACQVVQVELRTMVVCDLESPQSFQQATQVCQAWEGFGLASVRTAAEVNALANLGDWFGNWIGYVDNPMVSAPGSFVWMDGTAPAFNAWCIGQPNNLFAGENCVVMDDGCWHDVPCDWEKEGVICSRPDA